MNVKERESWLDILRGLAVVGVVVFHAGAPAWLLGVVTPWFLGAFFVASGYTYRDEYSRRPDVLIKKRFKSLYVPFVAWNLAYMLLHNTFLRLSILSDRTGWQGAVSRAYSQQDLIMVGKAILTLRATEDMAGALWFVIALITVNLLFCALSWLNLRATGGKEWGRLVGVAILCALAFSGQVILAYPLFFSFALLSTSFFYAGYLYRRYQSYVPTGLYPTLVAAIALYFGRGTILSVTLQGGAVATVFTVVASVYFVVIISRRVNRQPFLEYVGRNSFTVVALHFLAFKPVTLAMLQLRDLPAYMLGSFPTLPDVRGWWLAYSLAGILLPVAIKYGFDTAWYALRSRRTVVEHALRGELEAIADQSDA